MSYSDVQKALAVEIVARHGGEVSSVALAEVRQMLDAPDLPKSTVWRWLQHDATDKKAATPAAQAKAAQALDQMFEDTARLYLERAQSKDAITRTSGTSAVVAAATAVDKMRLLRGLPTEIVAILPELVSVFQANGWDTAAMFVEMIEKGKARLEMLNANR